MSNKLFMEIKTESEEMADKLREYILSDFKPNEKYFKNCINKIYSMVTFDLYLTLLPDFKIFEKFASENNTNLELMYCSDFENYLKKTYGKINNKGEYHSEKVVNTIIYAIDYYLFMSKEQFKIIITNVDDMTNDIDNFFINEFGINKDFFNDIDSIIQNLFDLKTGELKNKNINQYVFLYKFNNYNFKIIFDGVTAIITVDIGKTEYKKASKYDD